MATNYGYPFNYSEDAAPKYPDERQNEGWLEVVQSPNELPAHPIPTYGHGQASTSQQAHPYPVVEHEYKSPVDSRWGESVTTSTQPRDERYRDEPPRDERRRVLGLTVPLFWTLLILIAIILAGGIGGGVGGAVSAQQKSALAAASLTSTTTPTPTPTTASGDATATEDTEESSTEEGAPAPSDGGCPRINGETYTPYAADGVPVALEKGQSGQEFEQQCWTNYVASQEAATHNILRIYLPSLEDCMTTCAEYNTQYRTGLKENAGVGGGYCVAVSITKDTSGFCYLKNGTALNDTDGQPEMYSSAVLLTDLTME